MVFFKNIQVSYLKDKYGDPQRGLFAMEKIYPGELIWYCECGEDDATFTREQLLSIIKEYPKLERFVRSYSYMIDDDIYAMPITYSEEKNNDECALFNHSCEPNCGFDDDNGNGIRAIRTIEPGDELTYHYGFLETEASLIHNMECRCSSIKCNGRLLFDFYRDDQFVEKYFPFFTPYLKRKTIDVKEKWHSRKCFIKRVPSIKEENIEEWQKALVTLETIKKDELIASFSAPLEETGRIDEQLCECDHYLRHSLTPNCYVKGRDVFAKVDIPSETELTIYYHGVLL